MTKYMVYLKVEPSENKLKCMKLLIMLYLDTANFVGETFFCVQVNVFRSFN